MLATLPMYLRRETRAAYDAFWAMIRDALRDHGHAAPDALDHTTPHTTTWTRPDLVLGQICNLPYRTHVHAHTHRIGTCHYDLHGAPRGHYYSYIVARYDDPRETPAAFATARLAVNEVDSHSGWGAAWSYARDHGFAFQNAILAGSHRASVRAILEGHADIACIDAISWHFIARHDKTTKGLRLLAQTDSSPGQTLITANTNDPEPIRRAVTQAVTALSPDQKGTLLLRGIVHMPDAAYHDMPLPDPAPLARPLPKPHSASAFPVAIQGAIGTNPCNPKGPPAVTTAPPPVIEITGLHKSFGALDVLRGVDLSAKAGDVVSLIGSSGSGKSTLLRCANLLENSQQGEIKFEGAPVRWKGTGDARQPADAEQIRLIRTNLSMVFQSFNLWSHMTILQNVMEAPVTVLGHDKAEVEDRARRLLDKVGIGAKADAWPSELSGGQQQRAAIARALCMEPRALLFDEPTSALDPELEQEVIRVIRDLAGEGRTMILVTHDMRMARSISSHVVFLHQGLIEEQGPPSDLFGNAKSERLRQFLSHSDAG